MRFRADADHAAKLARLKARADDIGRRLAALDDERRAHAVAATDGDEAAAESIKQIDAEAATLSKEVETLAAAAEQLKLLQQQAAAEASKQERERREAEGKQLAAAIMLVNGELDAAMNQLRARFEQRAELLSQLNRLHVSSSSFAMRLLQRLTPTAAAHHAKLSKYLALEHVGVSHVAPLTESNAALARPAAVEEDAA